MKEKKDVSLKIRITNDDYENLKEKAKLSHMSVSEFVRQSSFSSKVNVSINVTPKLNELNNLIFHLSKIGNNLNQIAHHLNSADSFDNNLKTDIENSLVTLKNLSRQISDYVGDFYGNN